MVSFLGTYLYDIKTTHFYQKVPKVKKNWSESIYLVNFKKNT